MKKTVYSLHNSSMNQLHSRKSHSNLWSQGGWTFNSFSSEVFSTLDEEKNQLEKHLAQVEVDPD